MAAMRNSNYYELGLIHPRVDPFHAPVYLNYEDHLDSIDENGEVSVPEGPGFGVELDWAKVLGRVRSQLQRSDV